MLAVKPQIYRVPMEAAPADRLDIEGIAREVFGEKWQPKVLETPKALHGDRISYELHLISEDGSDVEVTMESSTGFLKNKHREATIDFLKLLQNYLVSSSESSEI